FFQTMSERQFDFIILGASGYTGQFVVEEVAKVSKETGTIKYAIAGRNKKKLENVLTEAKRNTDLDFSDVCIILTDVNDKESLYRFYGLKVVEACIEGGADHVDISGEPQYLEEAQLLHSEKAKEKGIHVVGSCGFDSGNAPINVTTLECALHGYASRKELSKIRRELFKGEKPPKPIYRSKPKGSLWWSAEAERWCLPNLASDRSVVMRTQNLNYRLFEKRPIQFNAFFGMQSIWTAIGAVMFGIVFTVMAPFSFTRNLFLKFPSVFSFGAFSREGAKREDLEGLKFLITFVGEGWDTTLNSLEEQHPEPPNVKKMAQVTGPDPGYFGTAAIITQCALTVLKEKDKLPESENILFAQEMKAITQVNTSVPLKIHKYF
ncbi:Saccharopine dehydrogenase-like oxidoreductase, partial [Armadillidium nasatum]